MTKQVLEARLFGTFELITPKETIYANEFSSPSLVKLLSVFLLNYGKEIQVTELIDLFWQNEDIANPTRALKNLVYRLRKRLEKYELSDSITSGKGFYKMYDDNIKLKLDVNTFDEIVKRLDSADDDSQVINLAKEAAAVYKGNFLVDFHDEIKIYNQAIFYESKVLVIYRKLLELLSKQQRYEELFDYSSKALAFDPQQEDFYEKNMLALYQMGKQEQAIKTYQNAIDYIYQNLGSVEAERMKNLYKKIIVKQNAKKEKIEEIKEMLKESDMSGAYLCEYEIFKRMCQLEIRRGERSGIVPYLTLINVELKSPSRYSEEKRKEILLAEMEKLQSVIITSLRFSDAITRYSSNQYIILLNVYQESSAWNINRRIEKKFNKSNKNSKVILQFSTIKAE